MYHKFEPLVVAYVTQFNCHKAINRDAGRLLKSLRDSGGS